MRGVSHGNRLATAASEDEEEQLDEVEQLTPFPRGQ